MNLSQRLSAATLAALVAASTQLPTGEPEADDPVVIKQMEAGQKRLEGLLERAEKLDEPTPAVKAYVDAEVTKATTLSPESKAKLDQIDEDLRAMDAELGIDTKNPPPAPVDPAARRGEGDATPAPAGFWYEDRSEAILAVGPGGLVVAVCSPDWMPCGHCKKLVTDLTPITDATPGVVYLKATLTQEESLLYQQKQRLEDCAFPFVLYLSPLGEVDAEGRIVPTILAAGVANGGVDQVTKLSVQAKARAQQLLEKPK